MDRDLWIQQGIESGEHYLLIVQNTKNDMISPIYFKFFSDVQNYRDSLLSPYMCDYKVTELIKLDILGINHGRTI